MQLNGVYWSVARILYGHAFNSQCSNTNRLVGPVTLNNITHYSKMNREVKMYCNVTWKHFIIINVFNVLCNIKFPVDAKGQYRGSIIHVVKTHFAESLSH